MLTKRLKKGLKPSPKTLNISLVGLLGSFILLIAFFTSVRSFAVEAPTPPLAKTVAVTQEAKQPQPPTAMAPKSIPEKNIYALSHMEKKSGFKYSLFKFFLAMIGVMISSLAIYGGLKLYKKIAVKNSEKLDSIDYAKTLESPKDFKEAINLFLDKTDK